MSAPAVEVLSSGFQGGSFSELGLLVLANCDELRMPEPTADNIRVVCRAANMALGQAILNEEMGTEAYNILDGRVDALMNRLGAEPLSSWESSFDLLARASRQPAAMPSEL